MNLFFPIFSAFPGAAARRALAILLASGAACASSAEPWNFAVMGDTRGTNELPGVNTQVTAQIALDIAASQCRFVLVLGDLIQGQGDIQAQYAAWRNAMAPVYQAGIPLYPVRGNHDCKQDPTGAVWRKQFPNLPTNGPAGEIGLTYSFAFSNVFCLALDQYTSPHRINQAWLARQLTNTRATYIFAYGHEPAFRVYHADCLAENAAARDIFWDSLRHGGAQAYFCGHDHLYNRAAIIEGAKPAVFQVIVGTGGAPRDKWKGKYADPRARPQYDNSSFFGYALVTVTERVATLEWKAILPDGQWRVLDTLLIEAPVREPNP